MGGDESASDESSGGTPVPFECTPGILRYQQEGEGNAHVREIHSGENGSFVDQCEGGNLVQYECETGFFQGPPEDPAQWPMATGRVAPKTVDCGGRCGGGVCPNVCPKGDSLTYVSVDTSGNAILEDPTSGWIYACELYGAAEGHDCTAVQGGDTVEVTQVFKTSCAAEPFFYTGFDFKVHCAYTCVPTPP
jgi:hypothetical protein